MQVAIATPLKKDSIEVVTVRDLGLFGETDLFHLNNATRMGYVIFTHDTDYVQLASQGIEHSGIILGIWGKHGIGDWVTALHLIHGVLTRQEMKNHIEYLSSLLR